MLPNIDPSMLIIVVVGVAALCAAAVFLFLVLQVLGGAIGAIGGLFGLVMQVLGGGPLAWCGCILLLFVCVFCALISLLALATLNSCGTSNPVNFCQFLG